MTLIYVLLAVLFFLWFRLFRTVSKLSKYQNFKSNVILRLAMESDMKKVTEAEKRTEDFLNIYPDAYIHDAPDDAQFYEEEIIRKISKAIDEEIYNEWIPKWSEIISATKLWDNFQIETSGPFDRAFDSQKIIKIIKEHREKHKEYIKK